MKYHKGFHTRIGQSDECVSEIVIVKKADVMLKDHYVKPIRYDVVADALEPSPTFSP